jgi:hypothetical protein
LLSKNPDPIQNLRYSDVTRCGSGSDTGVEHGSEKKHFIFNFMQIFRILIYCRWKPVAGNPPKLLITIKMRKFFS